MAIERVRKQIRSVNLSDITMWQLKKFKSKAAFEVWTETNKMRFQMQEIFIDNFYRGVEYKPLRRL